VAAEVPDRPPAWRVRPVRHGVRAVERCSVTTDAGGEIARIRAIFREPVESVEAHSGDDFLVLEVNREWMFRFPRAESARAVLGYETRFLAAFRELSPLIVPEYDHTRTPETVFLRLSKDDRLSRTTLFDRLRVLVSPTAVAALSEPVETERRSVSVHPLDRLAGRLQTPILDCAPRGSARSPDGELTGHTRRPARRDTLRRSQWISRADRSWTVVCPRRPSC
jgi:hypothetical protein